MTPVSPSIRFCFLVSTCLIRAGNFAREHIDAANFQRRWFRLTSAPKGLQFLSRDLRQFVGRVVRICVSLRVFYCLPEKEKFNFPEQPQSAYIFSTSSWHFQARGRFYQCVNAVPDTSMRMICPLWIIWSYICSANTKSHVKFLLCIRNCFRENQRHCVEITVKAPVNPPMKWGIVSALTSKHARLWGSTVFCPQGKRNRHKKLQFLVCFHIAALLATSKQKGYI